MKNSAKQTLLTIICIIIVFIPTYIALAFFIGDKYSDKAGKYEVSIKDERGKEISLFGQDVDDVAKSVLKINSKLVHTMGIDSKNLQEKYYDIRITSSGTTVYYRYYFSTDPEKKTIVKDGNGNFYTLEFKNVKNFLSRSCCYHFYDNSSLPVLSVFGGDDILPSKADWKYRTVSNSFVFSPTVEIADGMESYDMTGKSRLSFSIQPDELRISIYKQGEEIFSSDSFDNLPYDRLDQERFTFKISAKWVNSNDYKGYAEYEFASSIGESPEFLIKDKTIYSGQFFAVSGFNISAPQKIEFSSEPEIDFDPIFFTEGETVCALIPVSKDLPAPREYTFKFKYGYSEVKIPVNVLEREIKERDYDTKDINVSRNEENLQRYENLLCEIGSKYESVRYFNDTFLDYSKHFSSDKATLYLGFGHLRKPSNGETQYYLDGVDYIMPEGMDVPAVCAGKVVFTGSDALLGNFAVVDHGYGLKTWYCHLSQVSVTSGITISKGQKVGTSGKTGYTNQCGVYLITTIKDVPVSPYSLQENSLSFDR